MCYKCKVKKNSSFALDQVQPVKTNKRKRTEFITQIPLGKSPAPHSTARATRARISPMTIMASVSPFPALGLLMFLFVIVSVSVSVQRRKILRQPSTRKRQNRTKIDLHLMGCCIHTNSSEHRSSRTPQKSSPQLVASITTSSTTDDCRAEPFIFFWATRTNWISILVLRYGAVVRGIRAYWHVLLLWLLCIGRDPNVLLRSTEIGPGHLALWILLLVV